jgi:hypothetical protein
VWKGARYQWVTIVKALPRFVSSSWGGVNYELTVDNFSAIGQRSDTALDSPGPFATMTTVFTRLSHPCISGLKEDYAPELWK